MQQRLRNEIHEDGQGMDLPQGFPDESAPRKWKVEEPQRQGQHRYRARVRNLDESRPGNWVLSFSLLMMVVVVAGYFLVAEHEREQIEHARKRFMHDQVEPLEKSWKEKYAKLEEEVKTLRTHEKELQALKKKQAKQSVGGEDKQVVYLKKYQSRIHQRIQETSRALLIEKFGKGPHQIEILVAFVPEFPKKSSTDPDQQRIVVELAPVDEMPHVVYWFLEQVSRGLYDGCSFHRNAGHVVQGGPQPNFLTVGHPHLSKRFKDSGFNSILFQEYSSSFPHKKYTLGLAGRPGGPDFYVSTRDNVRLHGPGGQKSYEDPSEADPCFAKVIEGFEVVDRMQLGPVKPGGYKAFNDNVAIISMKIL